MAGTIDALVGMFTENTGASLLDSGGAYGRNWERNQGKDANHWMRRPDVTVDRWEVVSINTFRYLANRLTYAADLDDVFCQFAAESDASHLEDAEAFAAYLGLEDQRVDNTCNWDNALDETLQYVEGEMPYNRPDHLSSAHWAIVKQYADQRIILLQYHGGCDVRGGYTRARVFTYNGDGGEFLHDASSYGMFCDYTPQNDTLPGMDKYGSSAHVVSVYSGELIDASGSYVSDGDLWLDGEQVVTEDEDGNSIPPGIRCPYCAKEGRLSLMELYIDNL